MHVTFRSTLQEGNDQPNIESCHVQKYKREIFMMYFFDYLSNKRKKITFLILILQFVVEN